MIASTHITNTEIFAFITAPVFKLLSLKILFIKTIEKVVKCRKVLQNISTKNYLIKRKQININLIDDRVMKYYYSAA